MEKGILFLDETSCQRFTEFFNHQNINNLWFDYNFNKSMRDIYLILTNYTEKQYIDFRIRQQCKSQSFQEGEKEILEEIYNLEIGILTRDKRLFSYDSQILYGRYLCDYSKDEINFICKLQDFIIEKAKEQKILFKH